VTLGDFSGLMNVKRSAGEEELKVSIFIHAAPEGLDADRRPGRQRPLSRISSALRAIGRCASNVRTLGTSGHRVLCSK